MQQIHSKKEFFKLVKKECSQIVDFYKKNDFNYLLWRGITEGPVATRNNVFYSLEYPKDRKPRNSTIEQHQYLNFIFSLYGCTANRSNSIFCVFNENIAINYSRDSVDYIQIVFPKDNFKFTLSEMVYDFWDYGTNPSYNIFRDLLVSADLLPKGLSSSKLSSIERNNFFRRYYELLFQQVSKEINEKNVNELNLSTEKQFLVIILKVFLNNYLKQYSLNRNDILTIVDYVYSKKVRKAFDYFFSIVKKKFKSSLNKNELYNFFSLMFDYSLKILKKTNIDKAIDILLKNKNNNTIPLWFSDRSANWYSFVHPTDVIKYDLFKLKTEKNSKFETTFEKIVDSKNEIMITNDSYYAFFPFRLLMISGEEINANEEDIKELLRKNLG